MTEAFKRYIIDIKKIKKNFLKKLNLSDLGHGKAFKKRIYYSHKEMINMSVITVTKENFENEILKSDKKVLLDFWASWCGPCMMVSPVVDEIAEEKSDIKVGKINVDEEPELANAFGISSIPTLFVMEKGKAVNKSVGAVPKAAILDMLK